MVFKSLRDAFGSNKPGMEASRDYLDWRKTIFTILLDRDNPTPDTKQVESVVIDLGMIPQETSAPWAISLNVVAPNIATVYLTSGDNAFNVGRNQPKAAHAAAEIIQMARELQPRTQPTRNSSLPEPGVVQFFFVTRSGSSVFVIPLQEVQQSGHPFRPLFDRFTVIRQVAEQIVEERRGLQAYMNKIKALYVMAFTPEKMDQDPLRALTQEAVNHLKGKNPAFKQRFEGKPPQAQLQIGNIQFLPFTHTPKNMQALMSEWLMQQHNVTFKPKEDESYFFHGMRNPQGRQNIFLFYFDFE
jgi:hypothetical protein